MTIDTEEQLELVRIKTELTKAQLQNQLWENRLVQGAPMSKGEFLLLGPVDEDIVYPLMRNMLVWSNLHPDEPITLTIDSPGGDVTAGFALVDFLRRLSKRGHKITTVAQGLVASMGAVLMQAGDHRVIAPRAWLMVHGVSGIGMGSAGQLKNIASFNERLQDSALELLAARSTVRKATLKKKWADDWWLNAHDALKAGFVDEIEES